LFSAKDSDPMMMMADDDDIRRTREKMTHFQKHDKKRAKRLRNRKHRRPWGEQERTRKLGRASFWLSPLVVFLED
jgi:hypothetical protein